MPSFRAEDITALVSMTEHLYELAQAQQWDQVAQLELERRPKLEAFFAGLSAEQRLSGAQLLRESIEKILHLDQQIMALGNASKDEVAQVLRQNQVAKRVSSAYKDNEAL